MIEESKERCREYIMSDDYADYLIEYLNRLGDYSLEDTKCTQRVSDRLFIAHNTIRKGSIEQEILDGNYRIIPDLYGIMETSNLEDSNILRLRRTPYLDLVGKDTLVGIIDTGIDYTNELFINADNTTRIKYIWDQSQKEIPENGSIENVRYGVEYNQVDINKALASENPFDVVPQKDENGHGTFLSGIVAGNVDNANEFTGIAPLSGLCVVKLKTAKPYLREFHQIPEGVPVFQENDIITAIEYLLDIAMKEKKPMSILIGLGTSQGDHDGRSLLSQYLNMMSNLDGICITTAAGNEGNMGHHFHGDLPHKEVEDIEIKVSDKDKGMVMELWALSPALFTIGIISPSGEYTDKISTRSSAAVDVSFSVEPTKIKVLYGLTESMTGNQYIILQFKNMVPGIWKLRIFNEFDIFTKYDIWMPCSEFLSADTYFLRPDPYITLVETGTTTNVITTGTYNHRNNSIYINSSRGYTLSNRVKPEIVAPGVNIYGPIANGKFGVKSGSSIAAAHVAGIAALLLQWGVIDQNKLTFNTSELKAILIKGANRGIRTYPNQEWGFGSVDAYKAFENLNSSK